MSEFPKTIWLPRDINGVLGDKAPTAVDVDAASLARLAGEACEVMWYNRTGEIDIDPATEMMFGGVGQVAQFFRLRGAEPADTPAYPLQLRPWMHREVVEVSDIVAAVIGAKAPTFFRPRFAGKSFSGFAFEMHHADHVVDPAAHVPALMCPVVECVGTRAT